MRSYQYIPFLKENGFDVTVSPFFESSYLSQLYYGENITKSLVIKNYLRRFFSLFSLYKYDLVIIEKELFPYFPAIIEQTLRFFKVKYIVDYDDALFHLYDQNSNKYIRKFLGNKIDIVMKNSSMVICGNVYLSERAKKAGAKKIKILPTVIDLKKYKRKTHYHKPSENITIGWIGSPTTTNYLKLIEKSLLKIIKNFDVRICIVGGVKGVLKNHKNISYINWSEQEEIKTILDFDIGIMPLNDADWAKGKCAYKIIQYMGCGLPVVSSRVGANIDVVDKGLSGFFATSQKEWEDSLSCLVQDFKLRTLLGDFGREKVTKEYSLEITSVKLLDYVNDLVL